MESKVAAGRALRGWGMKGNQPGFPGVLTVGRSLQTSPVPGQERPSLGQCHMHAGLQPEGCAVPGAVLGTQHPLACLSASSARPARRPLLPGPGAARECPFSE